MITLIFAFLASLLFESPFIGLEKLVFQGAGRNNSSETKTEITSSAQKQTIEDAESVEKTNNDSKTNQLLSQNENVKENGNDSQVNGNPPEYSLMEKSDKDSV